jgi:hypothetical protein
MSAANLTDEVGVYFGVPASPELAAYARAKTLPKPKSPFVRLCKVRLPRLPDRETTFGDWPMLAGLFTGMVVVGSDGGGNHYLAEVHPKRSTVYCLETNGELVPHHASLGGFLAGARRRPKTIPDIRRRYARAYWLIKLFTKLPLFFDDRAGPKSLPVDRAYQLIRAAMVESPSAARQLLGEVGRDETPIVQEVARAARTQAARWRARRHAIEKAEARAAAARAKELAREAAKLPDESAVSQAISSVKKPSRKLLTLARRAGKAHGESFDRLCYLLWTMSEWRAMLGIAELRITMDDGDGGYYPWLQEGLALQGLGRLDESKHALLKALRLFPDEPNVKETLAEVRAALRRAPRN